VTNSRDYQILYWLTATGKRLISDYPVDTAYDPWTCLLGWPVQGIWNEADDGSDVNAVVISGKPEAQLTPGKGNVVVTGDDFGQVNLYSYPVIQKKPPVKKYRGHSAHVYSLSFTPNDKYLISSGAGDLALIQWRFKQPGDPDNDPDEIVDGGGGAPAKEKKGSSSVSTKEQQDTEPTNNQDGAGKEQGATEEATEITGVGEQQLEEAQTEK